MVKQASNVRKRLCRFLTADPGGRGSAGVTRSACWRSSGNAWPGCGR